MLMKGFKFSALTSALVGAVALSIPAMMVTTPAADAQTASDDAYLDQLYSFLESEDSITYTMATQSMSGEANVWAAQMFCRTFEAGVSPADAFSVYTSSAISQASSQGVNVTEEMAYAVGLYGGAVMNLGSAHYCPQYQPAVEQALQSL